MLYNSDKSQTSFNEVPAITLGRNNENISFKFKNIKKFGKIKDFSVTIIFLQSFILDLNKNNKINFNFLELYSEKECKLKFEYAHIISDKNKINCLSKVYELQFHFIDNNYIININGTEMQKKQFVIDYNQLSMIKLLNNFLGEIMSITINLSSFV
jgi:hypothetical protein